VVCALLAVGAWASPTGLNNIPTADVTPEGLLVLQQYTNVRSAQTPLYYLGAKAGLDRNLEIGLDGCLGSGPGGPAVGQVKYRFLDNDDRLSAAVGIANITNSRRAGKEAFYIALKRNLSPDLRGHMGFLTQGGDHAFFVGADGSFLHTGWDWKVDAIQTHHGDDWLAAVGTIGPLGKNVLLEAWASFPTEDAGNPTFMLKFDWVIKTR